jgi:hypothetical protein
MASRSRRATGASIVDDADFTYSPRSASLANTVLLSTPSSFASSCTRTFDTTLQSWSRCLRTGPSVRTTHDCRHFSAFIGGSSS